MLIFFLIKKTHYEAFLFVSLINSIPNQVTWNKKLKRDSTFVVRLTVLVDFFVETAYAAVVERVSAGKHNEDNSDPSKRLPKFPLPIFLLVYLHWILYILIY